MAKDYSAAIERMKEKAKEVAATNAPSSVPSPPTPENKDYSAAIERMRRRREYEDKMAVVNAQRAQRQENRRQNIEGLQTRANEVKAKRLQERTQAVIKAELDEAKKNDGDAKLLSGEWFKDVGQETAALVTGFVTGKINDVAVDRAENAEKVKKLTDELAERKAYDYRKIDTSTRDFIVKSKYNKQIGEADPRYNFINGKNYVTDVKSAYKSATAPLSDYTFESQTMTPFELKKFNYIYATEGKEKAYEYYDFIKSELYARARESVEENMKEIAGNSKLGATALSLGTGALKGVSYIKQASDWLAKKELDPNDPFNVFSYSTSALRDKVTENWGPVGSFAYNTAMSMGDFLVASGISGGSGLATLILGSGSAADTTINALDRGISSDRAFLLGTAAGVIEAATEKWSIDTLLEDYSKKGIKQFIISNIGAEASEEAISEVANTIADAIIAEDKSYWIMAVNQYKQMGMSEGEAIARAVIDKSGDVMLAALGGAISGGIMSGGKAGISEGSAAIGKAAADTSSKLRGQEILRGAQNSEESQQQRDAQQKFTVLPTAVEQERAKARERGEVFDVGYERPYTGYANTAADDELDARVNAAQTVTEKTGIRYGASEKQISDALELSKALGRDVEFFNQKSADGKSVVDGFYSNENGHIYLNVNAVKKLETTISHELVHSFEGTPIYDELETYVMLEYERRGKSFDAEVARLTKTYEDAGRYQGEEAVKHDMVANFVEEYVLGSKRSIKEITKSKPSVARRMLAWLSNVLKKLERTSVSGDVFDEIEKIINEFDDAEASSAEEAPTNVGEENVATATENEVNADEEVVAENKTPATEASERSQGKGEKEAATPKETKKASERETAKTTVKESVRIAEADDMLAEAEAAYDAGEITEEELDATREVYDLWYETGTKPSKSGSGWNDGTIARGVKRLLGDKLEYSVSEVAPVTDEDIKAVERHFGTTKNFEVAGYLMTDGKMLDFSGKHWGDDSSTFRQVDHRDVLEAFDYAGAHNGNNGVKAMVDMIGSGQIRLMPESGGINLAVEPNNAQIKTLAEYIRHFRGEVIVDVDKIGGDTIHTFTYNKGTAPMTVIRDIMQYFEDETIPQAQPEYRQFLQFSVSEAKKQFQSDYETNVDKVLANTYNSSDVIVIGRTPDTLEQIGLAQLPVTIAPSHIYSIAKTEAEAKAEGRYKTHENYHGLGEPAIKKIMSEISDPIMIVAAPDFENTPNSKPRRSAHRIIAIVELTVKGNRVIAPIEIDAEVKIGNEFFDTNHVASYYDKKSVENIVTEVIAKENIGDTAIYYGNKKRIGDFVKGLGLQLPAIFKTISDSDTIIRSIDENVNRKVQNVTQTQQFKRWFGDWQNHPEKSSKVVNKDGTPKVMYHGSPSEFTVFEKKKSKASNLYGRGFYFTDSKSHANAYGELYEVYLNVRDPLSPNNSKVTETEIRAFLNAVAENEDYSIENYGTYDVNEILNKITSRDAFAVIQDINATAIGDLVEAVELFNEVNGTKYDGIMTPTETVVFKPNQIKSATGNRGTFDSNNPDIRYSVSETDAVEGVDVVASLPSKAKSALRTVERKIGISMAEALNLDLGGESGKYQTQEFRNFLADVVRPLTEEYLETGEISAAAVRNMFEDNYEDIPGMPKSMYTTQKANDLSAFEKAINDNWNELRNIRRYAEDARREKVMRVTTPITTSEAKERFKALKDAQRFEAKVVRNNLLTEEDNLKVGELLRGDTIIGNLTDGKYNIDGIKAVYEAKLQTKEAADAVSKYKQQVAASRRENAESMLEGSDKWKDKGNGFAYARETIERNIVDVTNDKATADKLIREIAYPVHEAEAKSTKWKDEMKARVKALNLSTKVKKGNTVSESYAVQFYGEASENIKIIEASRGRIDKRDGYTAEEWKAALEAMWQENPNLDKAKIERAVEEFRAIYEEIFEIMNDVRIRNGYAPVEYRKGYFPHFTGDEEGVLAKFGRALGIKTEMMKLPTTINGMTGTFKPGITWFGHAQSRQGIYTTYDAVTGFEQYINGAADVIFHTDNIQNLRALATMIRYNASEESIKAKIVDVLSDDSLDDAAKEAVLADIRSNGKYRLSQFVSYLDEYTNLLANKKSKLDRGVEELFGRKIYVVVKNLESRVAANMVALNLGSALTNYIPINQAGAQLGWRWILQGMGQTVSNNVKADGIDDISTFIINRHGSDPLVRTFLEKASDVASKPMELVDNFTTGTIVRAAYAKYLHSGMTETEAMYQADLFAASVMADRSKGSMPTIFSSKNPLTKLLTQFQLEVNNEFSVIFKDIPRRERKKWTDAVAIVLLKYFIGAFLYNELYERIVGRRAAFDPIGIIKGAYEDFKRGDSFGDATKEALTEIGGNLPFVGGVLFEGGRIPISSALPDVETLLKASLSDWSAEKKRKTIGKELLAPLYYVAFPFGGGAVKKLNESISIIKNGGRYTFDSEGNRMLQYPFYKGEGLSTFKEGAKALMFGGTSTEAGREWVESDFGKLGAIETATYQSLIEAGMSSRKAHDFINDMREIEAPGVETKTENYEYLGIKVQHEVPVDPDAEVKTKAQLKREMLENSDLTGEQKSIVYFALMASDLEQVLMTELEGLGADMGEATDVLLNMKDAANTYEKMEILLNSDLRFNAKEWIYTDRISESRIEDIEAFAEADMDFDTFIRANMEYNRIYNEDLSASEKATALARWINQNGFDAEEKAVIEEAFKYYSMMPAKAGKYDDFTESGLDDETAYKLSSALADLEPLEGKTSVSELQKCRAVIDTIGSPTEQMKALESVMNKSNYKKCVTAGSYGVDAETYVAFREALEAGDKDGNGSISQAEAEAALDKLSGNLSDGERWLIELTGGSMPGVVYLSNTQLAVLWQLANPSWNPKNNPYSKSVGQDVQDLIK